MDGTCNFLKLYFSPVAEIAAIHQLPQTPPKYDNSDEESKMISVCRIFLQNIFLYKMLF